MGAGGRGDRARLALRWSKDLVGVLADVGSAVAEPDVRVPT